MRGKLVKIFTRVVSWLLAEEEKTVKISVLRKKSAKILLELVVLLLPAKCLL